MGFLWGFPLVSAPESPEDPRLVAIL